MTRLLILASVVGLVGSVAGSVMADDGALTQQEAGMINANRGVANVQGFGTNFEISVMAGFSSVDLQDLKKAMDEGTNNESDLFLNYLTSTGSYGYTLTKYGEIKGGFEALGSVFGSLSDLVAVGVKGIYISPGQITNEVAGTGYYGETFDYKLTVSPSVWAVLAGVKIQSPRIPRRDSWSLAILAGPAFANSNIELYDVITDPYYHIYSPYNYSSSLSGTGFYGEINLGSEYVLADSLSISFGIGYHYCNISVMKFTKNADPDQDGIDEVRSGDVFTDANGKAVNFNFSGFDINGGINIYF